MMSPLKHLLAFVVVCSVEFAVVDGQNTTLAVDNSTLAITTDADNSTDIYTTDITVIGNSTAVVGTTLADDNSTAVTTDASLTTVDSSIICYVCDENNDQDCGTDLSSTADYNETCQYNCWTILDSNGNTSRICNDTYESGSTSLSCDAASSQVCIDSSGVTECFYCCSSDYCNSETLSGSSRLPVASFITLLVAIVVSATNVSFTDTLFCVLCEKSKCKYK
ncbi:uncharacterized protein [Ptychodera flava]|uniref:uncharacterized protein n=1 Tax=Ptychodera flava TaxID=63121 RepID=UPI00396A83DD